MSSKTTSKGSDPLALAKQGRHRAGALARRDADRPRGGRRTPSATARDALRSQEGGGQFDRFNATFVENLMATTWAEKDNKVPDNELNRTTIHNEREGGKGKKIVLV